MSSSKAKSDIEIYEDSSFSYDGFQVVRGEFFAHIYEPSFSFNNNKVYVNMACIKKLPEYDYIQILVNPDTKKLAVRPCKEDEKDSFRWCSATEKRTPKQITCKMFYAKVMSLMGWSSSNRYKLLGKLIRAGNELLFVFDLESPEIYESKVKGDDSVVKSKIPSYSEDWKNQFGVSVSEHKSKIQIETFKGYHVFALQNEPKGKNTVQENIKTNPGNEVENDGKPYEQLSFNETEGTLSPSGPTEQSDSYTSQYAQSVR